jgi:hypothetical protein
MARPWLILIAGMTVLAALTYAFWPAETCSVVPALQIGSSGPRC